MAVGEMINGVLKADIERLARTGESYEQAAGASVALTRIRIAGQHTQPC